MFRLSEMIRALTGKEIQENGCIFSEAVRDSHEAAEGTLFVAIPGERTDGHKFIPDAFASGARAALIQEDVPENFRSLISAVGPVIESIYLIRNRFVFV